VIANEDKMNVKGTLIPIGGNEDKGIEKSEIYTLESLMVFYPAW
jgi:hypothetical protein